jgi:alkyl sulfatase BDS1-like metallo-beta-lactamase superfamily hydrolase
VAYATTSANVRNWSLTRALELDGSSNLERFRTHRFQKRELARRPAVESVGLLRVLLLPERAGDMEQTLRVIFTDGGDVSLTIRHGVAVPGHCQDATPTLSVASDHWFDMMAGKLSLSQALADGIAVSSDAADVQSFLRCFDLESLNS